MVSLATTDTDSKAKGAPAESGRHPDDRPGKRQCLSCPDTFESFGWGNRMCPTCRTRGGPRAYD